MPQLERSLHACAKSLCTAVRIQPPNFLEINKEWAKGHDRLLTKEDTQVANKHVKKCSVSYAIKELQMKTMMRYHYTPIRTAGKKEK